MQERWGLPAPKAFRVRLVPKVLRVRLAATGRAAATRW